MTRNTKLFKCTIDNKDIIYRELNCLELVYLSKMTNLPYRYEMAIKTALVDGSILDLSWPIIQQIGQQVITNSGKVLSDMDLFELTVKEYRNAIQHDFILTTIVKVVDVFPGTSLEYLLSMTPNDIIELGCLAELRTNKHIFDIKTASKTRDKKGPQQPTPDMPDLEKGDDGKMYFKEDGKSLQDKIKENVKFYGK